VPACPKPRPALLAKEDARRRKAQVERAIRTLVRQRDGGRCRYCHKPGTDVHHIRPRSLGGHSETTGLVLLCRRCHALVTGHVLRITGNADEKLNFQVWTN